MSLPDLREVRCPRCRALLFKGVLIGEVKCRVCGLILKLPRQSAIATETSVPGR